MEISHDIPVVTTENEKERRQKQLERESLNSSFSKEESSSNLEAMNNDQVERKTSPRSVVLSLLPNRMSDDAKQPLVKSNLDDDKHNSMDYTCPPEISRISSAALLSDWIPPPASSVTVKITDTEATSDVPNNADVGNPKPVLQDDAGLVDANTIEPEMTVYEKHGIDGDGVSHTSIATVPNCIPLYISIPEQNNTHQHPHYDDSTLIAMDIDTLDPDDVTKEGPSVVSKHSDCESVGEKTSQKDRKKMTAGGDFIVLGIQMFGLNHVSPMEHVIHSTSPNTHPDLFQENEEGKKSTIEMGLPSDMVIQDAEGSQIQSHICPKEEIQGANNKHNPGESRKISICKSKSTKPFQHSHIHYNPSLDVSNMVQKAYDNILQIETSGIFTKTSFHGIFSYIDKNIVPQNNDIPNTEIFTAKVKDAITDYEKERCSTEPVSMKDTKDVHDIPNNKIPLIIKQKMHSTKEASMKNIQLNEEFQEILATEVANTKDNTEKAIVENSQKEKEIREGTLADVAVPDLSEAFTSELAMENQKEGCKAEIFDSTIDSTLSDIPSITIDNSKMDINSEIINMEDSKQVLQVEIAKMKIEESKESTIHEIATSATEDWKEKTPTAIEHSNKTPRSEDTEVTLANSKEISIINIEESREMCTPEIRNTIMEDLEEDSKTKDVEAILDEDLICRLEAEIILTTIGETQSKEINAITMTSKESVGEIISDEMPSISVENVLKDINKGTMNNSPSQNTNCFTEERTFNNTQLDKESNLAQNCESETQNGEQTNHSASSHNRDGWNQKQIPKLLKQSHMHYNPSNHLLANFIGKTLNRFNSNSTSNTETNNCMHGPSAKGKDNVSATNSDSKRVWIKPTTRQKNVQLSDIHYTPMAEISSFRETLEKVMIQESDSGLEDGMCVNPLDTNTVQQGWNYVANQVKKAVNNHMNCNTIATNIDLNNITTTPDGDVCHENSKEGLVATEKIPCSLSMDKLEVSMEKIGSLHLKGLKLQEFHDIIWGQALYHNWLELMGMEHVLVQEWQNNNSEQSYLEKSFLGSTMHEPIKGKSQQQRNISYSFVRRTHLYQGSLKGIVQQCDYLYWNDNSNHLDDNNINTNNTNLQNPSCIISQQIRMEGIPFGGDSVVWEVQWVIVSCGTMESTDLELSVGISMPHIPKDIMYVLPCHLYS
jgi:hypothetical protein